MGALDGRVAIITGAGRGLGREHALLFASEGAKVVVNDLGGDMHGEGGDPSSAMQTVKDIEAMGGEAVVNGDNVADWDGARRMVQQAIDAFGDLHVLVNNAGILRDRVIINMTEAEWDAVIAVHLKGHFCPTRHAAAYWREQTKAGKEVRASIVHTSSTSGLFALADLRKGAEPLRRALERNRARGPHPAHRGDTRVVGGRQGPRRRLRRMGSGQRVALRRVPRDGRLPVHR
jgi:NAD(P)-dependent dehydrogenase (short-subunit alcohol dehydrogenase family)